MKNNKKKKKIINLIILCFSIIHITYIESGCNRISTYRDGDIPEINLKKAIKTPVKFYLSNIAASVKYIALETNKDCIVGTIEKIFISTNRIYILDNNDVIYLFDKNDGSFIRKLNNKGRGPGEYVNVIDFCVIPDNNQLCLLGYALRKILIFDENGSFIKQIKIKGDGWPIGLEYFSGRLFLFYPYPQFWENRYNTFTIMDLKGNILSEKYNRKAEWGKRPQANIPLAHFGYSIDNESLIYWEEKSEYILKIDKDLKIQKEYKLIGNIQKGKRNKTINDTDLRNYFLVFNILKSSNYVFINGYSGYPIVPYNLIFNEKDGTVSAFQFDFINQYNLNYLPKVGFYNDLDNGWPFYPTGKDTEGNLFCLFDPWALKKLKESEPGFNILEPKLKSNIVDSILRSAKPYSNPVIMFIIRKNH